MKSKDMSERLNGDQMYEADLEQALSIAGVGWYTVKYCFVLTLILLTAMMEVMGFSYVLLAAKCDLNISDYERALISSLPFIAIILTSYLWGYILDTKGRKKTLIYSSLLAGAFGILAGFMPDKVSYSICKLLSSLCIFCPVAAPYSYIGEIVPKRHIDLTLAISNAMQMFGSPLLPLMAWGIVYALDFRIDFGLYYFRPWRLLTMACPLFVILSALLLLPGPESPQYLVSQGRYDEALKILQIMFSENKKRPIEDFPVKILKIQNVQKMKTKLLTSLKEQSLPVLKPPFGKWFYLNGFLMLSTMAMLSGLCMWTPDITNRVLSGEQDEQVTACEIITQGFLQDNTTLATTDCVDTLDKRTFIISAVANGSCAVIAVVVSFSVKFISKKIILVTVYAVLGSICVGLNFITNSILFVVLLAILQLITLSIGFVNAYTVEIFPTYIRGMAVSLCMMLGRVGSIAGTNIAGAMVNNHCEGLFNTFGGWMLLCGLLSLLLPKSKK